MANETRTTIIGNLTADPELRYTQSGVAVANVTVASTERVWDKNTGGWKDADDTLFLRGSVWRTQAENVAESLSKGDRVIAYGKLRQRSFDDKDGNRRSVIELDIEEIGPALTFATATMKRGSGGGGRQSVSDLSNASREFASAGFTTSSDEEPPF